MRRMDRYNEDDTLNIKRQDKNQELYQDIINNTKYTNITDVTNANAYEISDGKNPKSSYSTREAYQTMMKYQDVEHVPKVKKELDDFNYLYQRDEKKVYDINSVLEEARKNRQEKDALEEKRKLKNTSYNILAGLNKEELEKYREEKRKKITTSAADDSDIRNLIDTITSKTLAGEIDRATSVDLLSELMATNVMDKVEQINAYDDEDIKELKDDDVPEITASIEVTSEVITPTEEIKTNLQELVGNLNIEETKEIEEAKEIAPEDTMALSREILKEEAKEVVDTNKEEEKVVEEEKPTKEEVKEEIKEELTKKDDDFYTRSMDLSDKDFDMSNDFKEKSLPLPVKIILILLIIAVIVIAGYFIYQKIA